jgi:hypothetical protein
VVVKSVCNREKRACSPVATRLADANQRAHRGFLLRESRISKSFLFNGKDGVKDCLKLPSYNLTRAQGPKCNTARILNPASSKHLSSKCDTSIDQSCKPPRNLAEHSLTGFKLLKAFINHLLSTIHYGNPLTEIPNADCWGLGGDEDGFIDLDSWDPRQISQNVYKVIALPATSDLGILTPIHPQWAILGGGLRPSYVKSIRLPSREVFEIRGSHLLLVILYRVKVRVSNRKTKFEESRNSILIPVDLKVVDLVKTFKFMGNISGIFQIPESSSNIRTTDTRTATDLGWRHGTELRLEIL